MKTNSPVTQRFLDDVKKFMQEFPLSKTAFGIKAVKDPHAITDWLEKVNSPTAKSMDKVYAFMDKYRKENA